MITLKSDCSSIVTAEKSDQPEDWLLHPTGHVFNWEADAVESLTTPKNIVMKNRKKELSTGRTTGRFDCFFKPLTTEVIFGQVS